MLADLNEREQALDPARSFIVEAPAGSGKTGLLVQRYLRLLGVVDRPESIVAMTFMRKAAGEMKQRIYDALLAARDGVLSGNDFDLETRRLAVDVLAQDQAKILESAPRSRQAADPDHRFLQWHARAANACSFGVWWRKQNCGRCA